MDENEKLWSALCDPGSTMTRSNEPQVTKQDLEKMFEVVRKQAALTQAAKRKPVRFKKDGPLIYPEHNILLISEKYRDTEVGDAITWLAWYKIWWLKAPLNPGDIYAVDAMIMDPLGYRPGTVPPIKHGRS